MRTKLHASALAAALVAVLVMPARASAEVAYIGPEEIVAHFSSMTFTAGTARVTCDVVLTGSLAEAAVTLRAGTRAGSITRVAISGCSGGTVSSALGAPWSLNYVSALGSLPEAASGMLFELEGFSVTVQPTGAGACLFSGSLGLLLSLSEVSEADYDGETGSSLGTLRITAARCSCSETVSLAGNFSIEEGAGERLGIIILVFPIPPALIVHPRPLVNFRTIEEPAEKVVVLMNQEVLTNVTPTALGIIVEPGWFAIEDINCALVLLAPGERCRVRVRAIPFGEEGTKMRGTGIVTYLEEGVERVTRFAVRAKVK